MKYIWIVCAILTLLEGSALGNISTDGAALESSPVDGATALATNSKEDGGTPSCRDAVGLQFINKSSHCLTSYDGFEKVQNCTTLTECGEFFTRYCQDKAVFMECLSGMLSLSHRCNNQTFDRVNHLIVGMMNTSLNLGCEGNGETFSSIYYGFRPTTEAGLVYYSCLEESGHNLTNVMGNCLSYEDIMLFFHRSFLSLQECVFQQVELEPQLKSVYQAYINDLRRLDCIHPERGMLVPCSSIDNGVTPRKFQFG